MRCQLVAFYEREEYRMGLPGDMKLEVEKRENQKAAFIREIQ